MSTATITKHLKLPFQFDENRLLADLAVLEDSQWALHFNTNGYEGNWKVIALYAIGGQSSNIFADPNIQGALEETEAIKACPYFKEVVGHFQCPLLSVRLLRLNKGAVIKPHTDNNLGYEDDCFRLHIPITTNPDVEFMLDGEMLKMLPGECWYTNVNYMHSVANRGETDRIHLVLDGQRNAWSDQLFFSLAPEESFFPQVEISYSTETIQQMIQHLQLSDTPAAAELIASLEDQLKDIKVKEQ
jgi:hypothetical protein